MHQSENQPGNKKPVRIGILLNSYNLNYPYYHIIETLKQSGYAEVVLVVLNKTKKNVTAGKIFKNLNYTFFHVYQKFDSKIFKPKHSVLKSKNCKSLIEDVPLIEVEPETKNYFQWISESDLEKIKSHRVDVFIRMGFKILKGGILHASKYGIWSYHHADNKVNRGGPPAFWEMYENNPVTGTIVQILSEDLDNGLVLSKTLGATHKFSMNVGRNSIYAKGMFLMPRLIKKLYEEGDGFVKHSPAFPEFYSHKLFTTPTNLQVAAFIVRMGSSSFLKFIRQLFFRNQWFLLYHISKKGAIQPSMRKMKKLQPPKGTFWADPHVVFRDGKYHIFIEEKFSGTKNAHISVITMDEKGKCSEAKKIIERPYHLSYPFVFYYNGTDYMIPESKANNTIELYRCESFPDKWTFHSVIMENVMALDTTLHFHDNKWWMFMNRVDHPAVSSNDELFIYHASTPFGPWTPHRQNPVVSDVRRARPAGKIFSHLGKTYRPSQDCSVTYGYGIRINEIIVLNEEEYVEKEIDFIEPLWDDAIQGVHSFVFENQLTLIDAVRKVSKW